MKKNVIILILILTVALINGCTSKPSYVDGTYKAKYVAPDSRGWTPYFQIIVKNKKISSCTFDAVNKEGNLKSKDAEYNAEMKAKAGTSPAEYSIELVQSLVSAQDPNKVDSVSGATASSKSFKALATAATDKAKKGDQTETMLAVPNE